MRSFVYRERRPSDPMRLKASVGRAWPGVVRTKGFFWLATRPHHVGEICQAGALVRTGKRGVWWARCRGTNGQTNQIARRHEVLSRSSLERPVAGDRPHRLRPDRRGGIRSELDACLVPERDFMPDRWRDLPDPFRAGKRGRHQHQVPCGAVASAAASQVQVSFPTALSSNPAYG